MGFWAAALPFLKSAGGGALAGGALSALGSVFGKSNNSLANSMGNIQHDLAYRGMQIRVNDLKKAGLHPSLAAGQNPGNIVSVPQPEQSSTAKDMAQIMGQAIANSAAARQQAKLTEAQIRLTNAEAANLEKMGQQSPGTLLNQTDQAQANKDVIPLDPVEKVVAERTGYKQQPGTDVSLYFSPAQLKQARVLFGDEPVDFFMGLPNMARNAAYQMYKKIGKGRTFSEFLMDNSKILRAFNRTNDARRTRGQLKRSKWR